MRNMGKGLFVVLALVGFVSAQAKADCECTKVKPGLAKHANVFAETLEKFDEALHTYKLDEKVVKVTHHFEEGVLEFNELLTKGETCKGLVTEFQHFHEDIQLIYKELNLQKELFHTAPVLNAWNRMVTEFVRLQNHLYYY